MAKSVNKGITEALRGSFDLDKFKKTKNLIDKGFKPQQFIPLSDSVRDVLAIPGIPHGHISILRGHSDTGKSTLLFEIAAACQRDGILPVFIITEMKFNWEHAIELGVQATPSINEKGDKVYDGNFIYVDRSTLNTIEDVAAFMTNLLDAQDKGDLPMDLCFFWDSVGSIPCEQEVKSNSSNNKWKAGAMQSAFGNWVNQRIMVSRKNGKLYTNSFIIVNKIWNEDPDGPMGQPAMANKGGKTMLYDATLMITFGNPTKAGTKKLSVVRNKRTIEWGKITNIQVDKYHTDEGIYSRGKLVMTKSGFIANEDKDIEAYKKKNVLEWVKILGGNDESELSFEEEKENDLSTLKLKDLKDLMNEM